MKIKRKFKWIVLFALFLLLVPIIFLQSGLSATIQENLRSYLTCADKLPENKIFDGVYILGGNQESLKAKYKTMAKIYGQSRCKEINILSRHGITEYNASIGRNLSNDEWSLLTLEDLGVSKRAVQPIKKEPCFFGTYSEAKWISRVAEEKGWKNLLLITSPHHTKRVKKSFNCFLNGTNVNIWVTASKYNVGFWELLNEFFKLKFYQFFLLC